MLLPWAALNGELGQLFTEPRPFGDWVLLWGCAAFGGVRIYSQFAFLAQTSATTLAMSNLAIQALTILLSIVLFGTPLTTYLGLGVTFTILMSALFTFLKLSKVLVPKATTSGTELELEADAEPSHEPSKA